MNEWSRSYHIESKKEGKDQESIQSSTTPEAMRRANVTEKSSFRYVTPYSLTVGTHTMHVYHQKPFN